MGLNYFMKKAPEEEEKEQIIDTEECVQEDDFIFHADNETVFHICKTSGGWKTTWALNFFLVWKQTGDHRWKIVEPFWNRANGQTETTNVLIAPEVIPGLTETDIMDVLCTPGYYITTECGGRYDISEFWHRCADNRNTVDLLDSYIRQKQTGPAYYGQYTRQFQVGWQLFTQSTDFS